MISSAAEVQAFVNWAEKHPNKWTATPFEGVVRALRENVAMSVTRGDGC